MPSGSRTCQPPVEPQLISSRPSKGASVCASVGGRISPPEPNASGTQAVHNNDKGLLGLYRLRQTPDTPNLMQDGPLITALSLLPRARLSRWMGASATAAFSRHLIRFFVWWYAVDLSELDRPLADFRTLQAFFTRRLRAGARPIRDAAVVSPVDGELSGTGCVVLDGFTQSVAQVGQASALLLSSPGIWDGVAYAVLYLSPRDYHRVHAPFSGVVTRLQHVPGERWPVFAAAVRRIPRLFEGNERLIIELSTTVGPAAVVLVGALGVGEITTPLTVGSAVEAGDEVGCFGFGSTVIVFHPQAAWQHAGGTVRVGEPLTEAGTGQ